MKRHRSSKLAAFTLVAAAVLAATPLWAQCQNCGEPAGCSKRPRVIVLDFKTTDLSAAGCSSPDTPLAADQPVAFRIMGINPYRHTVTVKINQVNFESLFKPPALISSQLLPKAESANTKEMLTNGEKGKQTTLGFDAKANPENVLWQKLSSFSKAADKLVRFDSLAAELRMWALLEDDLGTLKKAVNDSAGRLCKESEPPCDPSPVGLLRARDQIAFEVESQFNAVLEARASLQGQKLTRDVEKVSDVEKVFEVEKQRYKELADTKIQRDQQFQKTVGLYAKILEPGFGTLSFGPVAATGDQVEIVADTSLSAEAAEIKLTSAAGGQGGGEVEKKSATSSTDPLLVIPVLGRHRPSFSTGVFFTGLVSPTFFKDENKLAQRNETDRFTTALGAMVHTPVFYWFRYPDYSVHMSLGVALKDNNPIYVLGPSLIIGRRQRSVLTVGLAGGQVNRLSGIKLGGMVTGDQPSTVKVFRTNFFFALTYNFDSTSSASTDTKK